MQLLPGQRRGRGWGVTNWEAVRTGSLDELGAAVMERVSDQRDDPSSHEQEYADACLALIERCKAAEAKLAGAVDALGWFMPLIREDYEEARAMSGDYSTREFGTWVTKAAAVLKENGQPETKGGE
jgi:hypothetical protein